MDRRNVGNEDLNDALSAFGEDPADDSDAEGDDFGEDDMSVADMESAAEEAPIHPPGERHPERGGEGQGQ